MHTATDLVNLPYFQRLFSSDHADFVAGSLKNMYKRNLFFTYIHRVQITFQLGCEQQKTLTENNVQDMTKILRNIQCAAQLYLFQNSF